MESFVTNFLLIVALLAIATWFAIEERRCRSCRRVALVQIKSYRELKWWQIPDDEFCCRDCGDVEIRAPNIF